jgi:hypothetical protein
MVSKYMISCPSTNPPLLGLILNGILPTLTLLNAVPGQNATVHHDSNSGSPKYVVFYSGPSEIFVPVDGKGQVAVPANMTGRVYAVATTSETKVTDKTMFARPITLMFD